MRRVKGQEEGKTKEGEEKQGRKNLVLHNRNNSLLGPEVMGCQRGDLETFIATDFFCDKRNIWTFFRSRQAASEHMLF